MTEEHPPTCVLDASALLAYLHDEPGGGAVGAVLKESAISSVNWAEVVQKALAWGLEVGGLREDLAALGLRVEPFTPEDADLTAQLWLQTKPWGLSLGDRACLALGLRNNLPVFTADRAWAGIGLAIDVRTIR